MGCRGIWIGWLSLATGVLWAGTGSAAAQESSLQQRLAARLPIDEIPGTVRERVRQVVQRPTLFGHGPTEAFSGDPATYHWLLDHPDRGVAAWRKLGAKCSDISERGNGTFAWTDGHGSEIHWQTVHTSPSQKIWYAEGRFRPGLLLPQVPVRIVVVLRHGEHKGEAGKTFLYHQAHVFVQTDSKTAALAARMLGDSAPRLADQCLGQLEMFFSALVWYLDQHPEKSQELLAMNQPANKK
jgi:hypothetical protein